MMCVITLKSSHRPDGKIADELALILAFTTANDALVKQEVRAEETSKVPIASMGFSHVSRFVLAGRRCSHQQWHGDLFIVHHHG